LLSGPFASVVGTTGAFEVDGWGLLNCIPLGPGCGLGVRGLGTFASGTCGCFVSSFGGDTVRFVFWSGSATVLCGFSKLGASAAGEPGGLFLSFKVGKVVWLLFDG
jgi:hypothetical protein